MIRIPVTINFDPTKIVGYLELKEDAHITCDSIITPEVRLVPEKKKNKIVAFSLIDRDQLISKVNRQARYGDQGWKEKLDL